MNKGIKNVVIFVLLLILPAMLFSGAPIAAVGADKADGGSASFAALDGYGASALGQQIIAAGFAPVLHQGDLTLFYKQETAEIALYSAKNDEISFSNPQDISEESKGLPYHRMMSQLYITYYEKNSQVKYYSSYYDSLGREQTTASVNNGTLSVNYVFGKIKITKEMLPKAIPGDKFESKVLSGLTDEEALVIKSQYKRISAGDSLSESTRKKYSDLYKNFTDTDLYILNEYIPDYEIEPVYTVLFKKGYTKSDFKQDNEASGNSVGDIDENVIFELTLNYRLDGDCLVAELDCSKLSVRDNAAISSVGILEFFGGGGAGDTGYVMLPDGSGGLVNFNSTKSGAAAYSGAVYGSDLTIRKNNLTTNQTGIQLPVIGISRNSGGLFAVIEEGAEYCSVNAAIAGEVIPYNVGYVKADINPHDQMSVMNPVHGGGTALIYVHQQAPYQGRVAIRYSMLDEGKNTYSDMANLYRNRLIANGTLNKKLSGEVPFVYGVVGAIDVKKHFMGIPYTGMKVLTSFDQARQIAEDFAGEGITNQHVQYLAWCNGGLKQTLMSKVNPVSCLGGNKAFKKLMDYKGATVYPNIVLTKTSDSMFDGFSVRRDAARLTYKESALVYPVSIPKSYFDYSKAYSYIVSPSKYEKTVDAFLKKYNYNTVSLDDIARTLNSDFSEKTYVERSSSLKLTKAALDKIAADRAVMAAAPNLYAVPAVMIMTDIPLSTSGANIINSEIPFLQMVFSGYKDMACAPANLSDGNFDLTRLLCYATLPNYLFSFAESSAVKDTAYSYLYSLYYRDWQDEAAGMYHSYVKDMNKVRGQTIIRHTVLENGIVTVEYENGGVFIINDTLSELGYSSQPIPPKSYLFKEAE